MRMKLKCILAAVFGVIVAGISMYVFPSGNEITKYAWLGNALLIIGWVIFFLVPGNPPKKDR